MKTPQCQPITRILLIIAALLLIGSLFVPIWQIDLDAPQYPEGLTLLIHAHKLAGDVEIINGLNHYSGMKTLHTKDFVEFAVLPYMIGAFALFFLLVALSGKRRLLNIALIAFVLFGIIAMVDFWKWEYDYGHNLNPNAAIIVPGMAYQPPLIGFKQLLNFGAFSVPALGGWLFVAAGLLVLSGVIIEWRKARKKIAPAAAMLGLALVFSLSSCSGQGPEPIVTGRDHCAGCKMAIADNRFACELITSKGRVYKFDDLHCLVGYVKQQPAETGSRYYVSDFHAPEQLIDLEHAVIVLNEAFRSPMGGNMAAFKDQSEAGKTGDISTLKILNWNAIK